MKTTQPKASEIKRAWHLIDARDQVLGRLASKAVILLMGKNKRNYVPHLDLGDWVVVINAQEVKTTGKKEKQKVYYHHSGYPGGLKETKYQELKERAPEKIIKLAVRRMLPDNRLRSGRMRRLIVSKDSQHPYPEKFKTEDKKQGKK